MLTQNIKRILSSISGALVLEDFFPHSIRRPLLHIFGSMTVMLLAYMLIYGTSSTRVRGSFLLASSGMLLIMSLEAYFYSTFVRSSRGEFKISFEIAKVIFYAEDTDLVRGFLFSDMGDEVMKRLCFSEEDIKNILIDRKERSFEESLLSFDEDLSVEKYAHILWQGDPEFSRTLVDKGIIESDFTGALRWVVGRDWRRTERERWWSRERLGRIPGLAKQWGHSDTFIIDGYGIDITSASEPLDESYTKVHEKTLRRLESILTNGNRGIVLSSDDEASRLNIVTMLANWIKAGKAMPTLEHKRVYLINSAAITGSLHDKASLEHDLANMLEAATKARNAILVFQNFSALIQSAELLGVDLVGILTTYTTNPALQIIAMDSKSAYEQTLASKAKLGSHFEIVEVGSEGGDGLVDMLQSVAEESERHDKIFVTYPALIAIAEMSQRSRDTASVPERAKLILLAGIALARQEGLRVLSRQYILKMVGTI